ncbi:hypothetical protein BN1723_018323, partial [Verticillium longisporum]
MLAVASSHRGKGIATALVKKAIDAMATRSADEIVLETEETNIPAVRLYERLGFLRSKKLHRYYLNGNSAYRLHKWADYTTEQASTLRGWMLELCQGISQADPLYIRNKTAQLWVEVAKRSWGTEWMDMDELLVQLWQVPDSAVHKELVMTVLETLGYETFFGDDVVVAMRQGVLCKGWTEITTPTAVLAEAIKNRNPAPEVRYGDEGWLVRLVTLLEQCLNGDINGNSEVRSCAVKALSVLSTLMPCTIPKGTAASKVVPVASRALAAS